MIYKFIDNNGSEITVNSLSSLQALVDSDTINEDTKVKAGLRGKWTTASAIEGLVFSTEVSNVDNQETEAPQGDIKSFITGEEKKEPKPEEDEYEYVEEIVEEEVEVDDDTSEKIDQQEEEKIILITKMKIKIHLIIIQKNLTKIMRMKRRLWS